MRSLLCSSLMLFSFILLVTFKYCRGQPEQGAILPALEDAQPDNLPNVAVVSSLSDNSSVRNNSIPLPPSPWELRVDSVVALAGNNINAATLSNVIQVQMTLRKVSQETLPAPCFTWELKAPGLMVNPTVVHQLKYGVMKKRTSEACFPPDVKFTVPANITITAEVRLPDPIPFTQLPTDTKLVAECWLSSEPDAKRSFTVDLAPVIKQHRKTPPQAKE